MPKIAPCLWFDRQAEQAAQFCTSLFPDSRIDKVITRRPKTPGTPAGAVLTVDFTLSGQKFIGLNGGPDFRFNEAISFSIDCEDQAEVDRYRDGLIAGGGEHSVCGWLKDRYGVSWQVIPKAIERYFDGADREGAARAMEAMLRMTKIDVEKLSEAYEGVPA